MLSGGQKFGLLSTTLNNTSSISNINEFGNSNFDGSLTDGLLGEGGTSRKPGSHSNSKSVVLVKLTDSALKAIAEYVKQRVSKFLHYSKNLQYHLLKKDISTMNGKNLVHFIYIAIFSIPKEV